MILGAPFFRKYRASILFKKETAYLGFQQPGFKPSQIRLQLLNFAKEGNKMTVVPKKTVVVRPGETKAVKGRFRMVGKHRSDVDEILVDLKSENRRIWDLARWQKSPDAISF